MKKKPKQYEPHPIASLIPPMEKTDFQEFTKDILANGLLDPIVLYEGMVLDGRHRLKACDLAEVKPRFIQYTGKKPRQFVLSKNVNRRHLSASQRAMTAASIANYDPGEAGLAVMNQTANLRSGEAAEEKVTQEEAAKALNVSPRSVTTASKILDEDPKLAKKVASGAITLNAAAQQLAEKQAEQAEDEPVIDKTDWKVPKELQALWARRGEVQKYLGSITSIKNELLERQKSKDPLFDNLNFSRIVGLLNDVHIEIRNAEIYAVCTTCQGKGCKHCQGRGFLTRHKWEAVPPEIRAMRKKGSAPVQEEDQAA